MYKTGGRKHLAKMILFVIYLLIDDAQYAFH